MKWVLVLLLLSGCSSAPIIPYHTPVRAELPTNSKVQIGVGSASRVRGSQDDRATPLDKTPYQNDTTIMSLSSLTRLLPWAGLHFSTGISRPTDIGLTFVPYTLGSFSWMFGADGGIYFSPTTIEAKDVQGQPKRLRKGIISGWTWGAMTALGYRISSWWLVSAGIRRQAFNMYHDFRTGINDEWTVDGDHVVYFVDQGFNFGPWVVDASVFKVARRLGADERQSRVGFSLMGGIAW